MNLNLLGNAVLRCLKRSNAGCVAFHQSATWHTLLWAVVAAMLSIPTAARAARDTAAGREILFLVAARDFDFQEYRLTGEALSRMGCAVKVASTETTAAIATNDTAIKPDIELSAVDPARYEALIVVGGVGSVLYWDDSAALALLRGFAGTSGHVIGAIGIGPLVLAKAGLLKGRTAAVYNDPAAAKILADNGAKFSFRDVVADGQFITANGSDAADKFTLAIVKRLETGK